MAISYDEPASSHVQFSHPMYTTTSAPDYSSSMSSAASEIGLYAHEFPDAHGSTLLYSQSEDVYSAAWVAADMSVTSSSETVPMISHVQPWEEDYEVFKPDPDASLAWRHTSAAIESAAGLGIRSIPTSVPYTSHPQLHPVPLRSSRSSISSHRGPTDGYRSEDTDPTLYSPVKHEPSDWHSPLPTYRLPSHSHSPFSSPGSSPETMALHSVASTVRDATLRPTSQPTTFVTQPTSSPYLPRLLPSIDISVGRSSSAAAGTASRKIGDWDQAVAQVQRKRHRRRFTSPSNSKHVCEHCNRCFSRLYNLKNHYATHDKTRVKGFHCELGDCDRAFDRKTDLDRHIKSIHTQERDEVCPACAQGFTRRDTLRRHVEDGCRKRRGSSNSKRTPSRMRTRNAEFDDSQAA